MVHSLTAPIPDLAETTASVIAPTMGKIVLMLLALPLM
jgi:hypothetical protein